MLLVTVAGVISPVVAPGVPVAQAAVQGSFTSLAPQRILDTRADGVTVDGESMRTGALGPNSTISLRIVGRAGVPAGGVTAVAINVTAVGQTLPTFITGWPSGAARPGTSNLNPNPGLIAPNLVISKVGADGRINLYNSTGNVHLIADIAGWFASGDTFTPLDPSRIMDSRLADGDTDDELHERTGAIGATGVYSLPVTGRGGVPATGVAAVAVNITAVNQTAVTFITAWPSGASKPGTSNLNPRPGLVAPNMAVVKVGSDGRINLFNDAGTTDLIVDIVGWFPLSTTFTALTPARVLDTRAVGTTVDGIGQRVGAVGADGLRTVRIAGRGGVPASGVSAVVLNVTAVNQTRNSFITAYPAGQRRPNSSNLNPAPGIVAPNLVIAKVGPNGDVSLYNSSGTVDLIVDVAGWFSGDALQSAAISRIAAGYDHTCTLTAVGGVRCVGSNQYGQVGLPLTTAGSSVPVDIAGISEAISVEAAGWSTCVVLADSTVKCWGRDRALGTNASTHSPTAVTVPFLSGVVSLAGDYVQMCALRVDGTVLCWGDNGFGVVGPNGGGGVVPVPVPVPVANVSQLGVGLRLACAVIDSGLTCWGNGNSAPTAVAGVSGVVSVAVGHDHNCVLYSNGGVGCRGANGAGQLGRPGGASTTFVAVDGVGGMTSLDAGRYHTCAWVTGAGASCWGGNLQGQVGDGTGFYAVVDTHADPVALGTGIIELASSNHSCATTTLGVYCWGFDEFGRLGFPSDAQRRQSVPQVVGGL